MVKQMDQDDVRPKFPTNLKQSKYEIEKLAKKLGLDFFPMIFEIVGHEEMSELAAYNGYPVRYHHWTFGQESLRLKKHYRYALSIIYEMVIPTNPCYAYLLDVNPTAVQKTVMAHVYGHNDFFKNNVWFSDLPRNLHNILAYHSSRLEKWRREIGKTEVDSFLESCLSLANLFDPLEALDKIKEDEDKELSIRPNRIDLDVPSYMEDYINPADFKEREKKRIEKEKKILSQIDLGIKVPSSPVRDVLDFLLEHAALEKWQQEIMRIVRDENQYLWRGGLTKIMNEGWATFWHNWIMAKEGVVDNSELCLFAKVNAGVLGPSVSKSLNPYRLGVELWEDIKWRWDTGRHGPIWSECKEEIILNNWEEFIIFKIIFDKCGGCNEEFRKEWQEFSDFLFEVKANRGPIKFAFFKDEDKVLEWFRYKSGDYASLQKRISENSPLTQPILISEHWLDWAQKHQLESPLGNGFAKIFEVRKFYNDLMFIQDFFTAEFCETHQYYVYGIGETNSEFLDDHLVIKSRNYRRVKKLLMQRILNLGQPKVVVFDANFANNGELRLVHLHDGRDLDSVELQLVLPRLYRLWGKNKVIYLETFQTEYHKIKPWWEEWLPPFAKRAHSKKQPNRMWVRYSYNGKKFSLAVIEWHKLEADIKNLLPISINTPLFEE